MASTVIPTKLKKSQVVSAGPKISFDTDTIKVMVVVAGSGAPVVTSSGIQFVSDVTATNAEVTGTGYARQTISGATVAFDASVGVVDFSFSPVTFTANAAGFSNGRYVIVFKDTGGADSTNPVLAVFDPGVTLSVVAGDLVLTNPTGGLIQWS